MKVCRLSIQRFRGIKESLLYFDGHSLLIGTNNVGKSTICEALDLVLGPDRLSRTPPVEEFDFYNSEYLDGDGQPIPFKLEVVLLDLTPDVESIAANHVEIWHTKDKRILESGEVDEANPDAVRCLRLETVGQYDLEEDEFIADTYFSQGTFRGDSTLEKVSKKLKRMIGFLYLRALRTGSRALSLERGSLLDLILKVQGVRTGFWERAIKRLRELDPPISNDADQLTPVLENIEARLAQYISLNSPGGATSLYVSQLTREHLRKTIAFFLATSPDQKPVPFQEVGSGTLNALVLALLSFVAEAKKENVIFAMEEPEIAVPPHTQRRIANYLLTKTNQCFVTSHSPYVVELFQPNQTYVLRRNDTGVVTGAPVNLTGTLKEKTYRKFGRRGLAEAMLGQAVIVAEGISEHAILGAVAQKMEESDGTAYPLDLSGVTIFSVDGDGSLSAFGAFFKSLGLKTYAFYDQKTRTEEENQKLLASFDLANETTYVGIERLLVSEVSIERQWQLLEIVRAEPGAADHDIPTTRPADPVVSEVLFSLLRGNKGNRHGATLVELCAIGELPTSVVTFLNRVYIDYPKPTPVPVLAQPVQPEIAQSELVAAPAEAAPEPIPE